MTKFTMQNVSKKYDTFFIQNLFMLKIDLYA